MGLRAQPESHLPAAPFWGRVRGPALLWAGEGIFSASFANEWHFYEAEAKQRRSPVPVLQFFPISCCSFLSFSPSFSLSSLLFSLSLSSYFPFFFVSTLFLLY